VCKGKGCNCHYLNFEHAKMWPIYNIVTTQDEGGKTYLNLINIISKWCTMKFLAVLFLFFKTQN
jgi:hypothetical protein